MSKERGARREALLLERRKTDHQLAGLGQGVRSDLRAGMLEGVQAVEQLRAELQQARREMSQLVAAAGAGGSQAALPPPPPPPLLLGPDGVELRGTGNAEAGGDGSGRGRRRGGGGGGGGGGGLSPTRRRQMLQQLVGGLVDAYAAAPLRRPSPGRGGGPVSSRRSPRRSPRRSRSPHRAHALSSPRGGSLPPLFHAVDGKVSTPQPGVRAYGESRGSSESSEAGPRRGSQRRGRLSPLSKRRRGDGSGRKGTSAAAAAAAAPAAAPRRDPSSPLAEIIAASQSAPPGAFEPVARGQTSPSLVGGRGDGTPRGTPSRRRAHSRSLPALENAPSASTPLRESPLLVADVTTDDAAYGPVDRVREAEA